LSGNAFKKFEEDIEELKEQATTKRLAIARLEESD
jgi:hypothetical protein